MEKSKISINVEGGFLFCGGWNFLKLVSMGSTFIREMRVQTFLYLLISTQFALGFRNLQEKLENVNVSDN